MKKTTLKMWFVALVMAITASGISAQEMTNTALENPVDGVFKAVIHATPNMDTINGAVALAVGESAAWGDLSVIVRFNREGGNIDAHNGVTYALHDSTAMLNYAGDSLYTVSIMGSVYENTFTAIVTGYDVVTESVLTDTVAKDFSFRKKVTSLNYLVKAVQTDVAWGVPGSELKDSLISMYGTQTAALALVSDVPTIDGDLSDGYWDNIETNFCESSISDQVTGTTDLSGYWKAVWTADSVYIMANVTDQTLNDNGAPTWNTDGVHFYFDLLNERNGVGAGTNATDAKVFSQLYYTADGTAASGGNDLVPNHKIVANDTGYVVEVAYAWSRINSNSVDFTPQNGVKILLDVDIVDSDGAGWWSEYYWSSNQNCYSNMDNAGMIELAELDTTILVASRDSLKKLIDDAVIGQDNGEYLQSVADAANAAIVSANNVLATAKSQTELDNATADVNKAIAALMPNDYPIASVKTVSGFLPSIDGDFSEWEQMAANMNTVEVGTPVTGNSDLAGYWKAVWTADTLYVMADVQDSSLNDGGAGTWNTDGVHFYFGLLNLRNDLGAQGHDTSKVFSQIYYTDTTASLGGNATPSNVTLVKTNKGYAIEAAYAWNVINKNGIDFTAAADVKILMDVDIVNYNDPNKWVPQELYWGSPQNCWANMNKAGQAILSAEAISTLDFTALEAGITSAQADVDAQANNIGDDAGQYTQANVDAANTAIAAANAVVESATTQAEIDQAVTDLESAMALFVPNPVSVNQLLDVHFAMYPNPVNDVLVLDNIENVNTISVYSVTGKLITRIDNTDVSTTINLSELNSGVYLIKFNTDKGIAAKRFIKE